MRRAHPVLVVLIVCACAAQPPERSSLPDVEEVLGDPVGCQLSVGDPIGVGVGSVVESSAAEGILEEGDVITSVGGVATPARSDLTERMLDYAPGDPVEVSFTRDGSEESATVTLGENPNDAGRPFIGVVIETAFTQIPPEEADDVIVPSVTARAIQVGDMLYVFDPLAHTWQTTGIVPPEETRWVSTSSSLYSVTDDEPLQILDLMSGEPVTDDGFDGWSVSRLIGTVGDELITVVSMDVADQPGFVNLAVAGFDPLRGTTTWISPVPSTFGVPVNAYGAPDGTAFVLVGADPETTQQTAVGLYNADGVQVNVPEDLNAMGNPMGWFDGRAMAFRSSDQEISVYDLGENSSETYTLSQTGTGLVATTVGDGQNILAIDGRDLVIQSLTDPTMIAPLATNCTIGRAGDPGWGL